MKEAREERVEEEREREGGRGGGLESQTRAISSRLGNFGCWDIAGRDGERTDAKGGD